MKVPSLKKRIILDTLPLSKDVNSKTYEDTKVLLDLFLKVFWTENGEILKYLESGLNVPVDCTELKAYVLSGTVDEFIEQYNELLNHHDEIVEMQKWVFIWFILIVSSNWKLKTSCLNGKTW